MTANRLEKLAQKATAMAEAAGFGVWHTGGGCEAFGKMVKDIEDGDRYANMAIQIAHEGGSDIHADPAEPVWQVNVEIEDGAGDRPIDWASGLTLEGAIEVARGYEVRAEELWKANFSGDLVFPKGYGRSWG